MFLENKAQEKHDNTFLKSNDIIYFFCKNLQYLSIVNQSKQQDKNLISFYIKGTHVFPTKYFVFSLTIDIFRFAVHKTSLKVRNKTGYPIL